MGLNWLDSQRNSARDPGLEIQKTFMAAHLVTKWCHPGFRAWLAHFFFLCICFFPLQRQDSNLGCVGGETCDIQWGWSCARTARPPAARPPGTVCVPHRDTVWSLYNTYTISIDHKSVLAGPGTLDDTIWSPNGSP